MFVMITLSNEKKNGLQLLEIFDVTSHMRLDKFVTLPYTPQLFIFRFVKMQLKFFKFNIIFTNFLITGDFLCNFVKLLGVV